MLTLGTISMEEVEEIQQLQINEYVVIRVKPVEGKAKIDVNTTLSRGEVEQIIKMVNNLPYDRVVLVCRSSREHYTNEVPTSLQIEEMSSSIDKVVKVFYQEPWPASVPTFNSSNAVIRFGFNEGCAFDRLVAKGLEIEQEIDKEYITLLTHLGPLQVPR